MVPLGIPVFALCGHSIAVTRKVPSPHGIVAVCGVDPGATGTHAVPSQKLAPQPPGGGVGPVGAGPVGAGALGAQEFPFQNVFIPQPPGGGWAVTVGLGPPFFSQES